MRRTHAGLALAVSLGVSLAGLAVAATTVTPVNGRLGETVTVQATVPTGNNLYEPAYYVDWLDGACPATVAAARQAAIGDTTRGLGLAKIEGDGTDSVPVSAKVLLEQTSQKVCFYGGGGEGAGEATLEGKPVLPPFDQGKQPSVWFTTVIARTRIQGHIHTDPLGWAVSAYFKGRRATKGIITCNRKRFFLAPAHIRLGSDDSLSYSGPVRADNSNNYDVPIPLKYFGHARLRFHAPIGVGSARLKSVVQPDASRTFIPPRLGTWGLPFHRVDAHFSAPGFHPYTGQPSCGSRLKGLATVSASVPVMVGQATAALGDGINEAGEPHAPPN
jgi:hypothetical protein